VFFLSKMSHADESSMFKVQKFGIMFLRITKSRNTLNVELYTSRPLIEADRRDRQFRWMK